MKQFFSKPLQMRTILGLIIGLMGLLGLLLALIAGNIHRNLALDNHQEAMLSLVKLKSSDLLHELEMHARDLGVALQSGSDFRKAFNEGNFEDLKTEMSRQFHQYFVTAGILDLKKIAIYNLSYESVTEVVADDAEGLSAQPICRNLLNQAAERTGPQRAQVISEMCNVDERPYLMVLVAIGGLRPQGYLSVVVDPLSAVELIETALGMPIKIRYQNIETYRSSDWPPPTKMQDVMVAMLDVVTTSGLPAFSISVLSDYRNLNTQLRSARLVLIVSVTLITLIFIVISLIIFRRTTITPLRHLTARLRNVGRDQVSLLGEIQAEGAAEIQELAHDFNKMTTELGDLYRTLETMAFYDALTGLPNRNRFHERLTDLIYKAENNLSSFAILLMDLDRFKAVNDTLGHHVGDELLREVGIRLKKVIDAVNPVASSGNTSDSYMIARIGGDEFVAILPNITGIEQAVDVAQLLTRALESPCVVSQQKIHTKSSIGIVCYPIHGQDQSALMRRADMAMYHAKSSRRSYSVYDTPMEQGSMLHLALENELHRAIEGNELFIEYQPQIDLRTGSVISVEALVRWMHPEKGFVPPIEFIPLAEKSGLIHSLTEWVLERAMDDCHQWRRLGFEWGVSVNLSPVNLQHPGIFNIVLSGLKTCMLPNSCLTLELTESAVMADPEHAINVLTNLSETGIKISIDDFGTGHCSLSYVKKLPAIELKIDRSFVFGMNKNQGDMVIVRSAIDLGHNMGMSIVAEGVESEEVMNNLKALGCDRAQGYYITRPLPLAALINWVSGYEFPSISRPKISEVVN